MRMISLVIPRPIKFYCILKKKKYFAKCSWSTKQYITFTGFSVRVRASDKPIDQKWSQSDKIIGPTRKEFWSIGTTILAREKEIRYDNGTKDKSNGNDNMMVSGVYWNALTFASPFGLAFTHALVSYTSFTLSHTYYCRLFSANETRNGLPSMMVLSCVRPVPACGKDNYIVIHKSSIYWFSFIYTLYISTYFFTLTFCKVKMSFHLTWILT
jgi:hypothetical protein